MDDSKTLAIRLLQKGYSPEAVRKAFHEKGYPDDAVEKALVELGLTKPAEKPAEVKIEKSAVSKSPPGEFFKTGVAGFDSLLEKGVPRGITILVSGSAGTGKTLFCLNAMSNLSKQGFECLYISLEESEDRLRKHMDDMGLENSRIAIVRVDPFRISRSVEALQIKAEGRLLAKLEDVVDIIPKGMKPDFIFIDSITAIAAAFAGREVNYRVYIEQLFKYLEQIKATTFLISETTDAPRKLSPTGVEEFLADGIIVMYHIQNRMSRERVIEILKMRGAKHKERLVPFEITASGVIVYPDQEVFAEFDK